MTTNNHTTHTNENFLILSYLVTTIKQQRKYRMTTNTTWHGNNQL